MTRIASFCATGLLLALPALAMADSARFNIAAQPLPQALKAFAAQAHMQLLYQYSSVAKAKGNAVIGELDKHAALEQLLRNSGLEIIYSSDSAATIRPKIAASKTQSTAPSGAAAPRTGQPGKTSPQLVPADEHPSLSDQSLETPADSPQLEEVVVTGSRLPASGSTQAAQSVFVYTHRQIEDSGQPTLADFLNTIPQVSTRSDEGVGGTLGGATFVSLHGLPVGSTLVLIDGHPTNTGRFSFLDLSTIPTAAVERMEIIPVGSSAIYGSDALGGVVNIILRKDYEGIEANLKYSAANGTDATDANFSVGKDWERGQFSLTADFQRQTPLFGSERTPTSSTNLAALGGINNAVDDCFPGNVYSLTGQNLPGLNAPNAAIPSGLTSPPTIQEFHSGAGATNLCNPASRTDLTPDLKQEGVLASGHYRLAGTVELFSELLYSHKSSDFAFGSIIDLPFGSFGLYQLGASNPFNPFGENVGISYEYPAEPNDFPVDEDSVRPLVGMRGTVGRDWYWEVNGFYSHDLMHLEANQLDRTQLIAALNSPDPSTAFNPFSSGPPASPQVLDSLIVRGRDTFDASVTSGQAFARGPILKLPAGPLDVVFGGEYSRWRESDNIVALSAPILASRHTYAVFTEGRLPLWANQHQSRGGETLALSLAGRYDHSNDFGGKATGQVGLEWRPLDSVLLHGSYGTAYRAPPLSTLVGPSGTFLSQITDVRRDNAVYAVPTIFGPNPNLGPETGTSRTLGLTYADRGLYASLNWWAIDYKNRIQPVSAQSLIDFPSLFPGLVTRAPPSVSDQQNGFPGPITSIRDIDVNFGNIRVAGVDFDARYRMSTRWGALTPSVDITETYKWQSVLTPGAPPQNALSELDGVFLGAGFSPRWKGTAALNWSPSAAYSATVDGRYTGHYNDCTICGGPSHHELGRFWIADLNFRWNVGQTLVASSSLLGGAYLMVGGVNILNRQPRISYLSGYDSNEWDIRGRILYAQVGARW